MKKIGRKQKIICVICVISVVANIILAINLKDQIQYNEYVNEQWQQERDSKLYSVLNKIVIDWNFSEMSKNEIYEALMQDATYCKIARGLVDDTSLSDNDATFGYALGYTENYLKYLLDHKESIGSKECEETLKKIGDAFSEAIYRKDKSYIKKYYNVADQYGGEKSKIKRQYKIYEDVN